MADFTFPGPVNQEALRFLANKDIKPSFHAEDVWPSEHAAAFVSAKTARLDVLEDIRGQLSNAIEEGQSLSTFKRELGPKLQAKGWWGRKEVVDPETGEISVTEINPRRLRTIYDTNMRQARAAGAWERAQRTKEGLPYLEYRLGPSLEHREQHAAWAGYLLPVDDAFWDQHMPVNGWGCKCWVRQVSNAETTRRGLTVTEVPPQKMRTFKNRRTGEVMQVPQGVHPNFAGNPGKTRQSDLGRLLAGKLNDATEATANAALRDLAGNEAFEAFVKGEIDDGLLPVLRVAAATKDALALTAKPIATVTQAKVIELNKAAALGVGDWRFLNVLAADPDFELKAGRDLWLFRKMPGVRTTFTHGVRLTPGPTGYVVEELKKIKSTELEQFIASIS
jgi:hypothetical protein